VVVEVEEGSERRRALGARSVGVAVGPAAEQGADEALGLAVGARAVGLGAQVADPELATGAGVESRPVGVAVVGA
jgi:hypothetical protein